MIVDGGGSGPPEISDPPGPHVIYECVEVSESPWALGDFLALTLTESDQMIVRLSERGEFVRTYSCLLYAQLSRDVLAGRLHLRWAAPDVRRMRQAELAQALGSLPRELLESFRVIR